MNIELFLVTTIITIGVFLLLFSIDRYVDKVLEPKMKMYPENESYKKIQNALYLLYTGISISGSICLFICGLAIMYSFTLYVFSLT